MLVFDIETNAIEFGKPRWLDSAKTIHCIVIRNSAEDECERYSGDGIEFAVKRLNEPETIGGHNVTGFDIPVLQKFFPWFKPHRVLDSKVISEMAYPDLRWTDYKRIDKGANFPKKLAGRHSLESWGYRLGEYKDDYKQRCIDAGIDPWGEWSQLMEDYCAQDVNVNVALFGLFKRKGHLDTQAAFIESDLHGILKKQEDRGFTFDLTAAHELHATLSARREELHTGLVETFGPFYIREGKTVTHKRTAKFRRLMGIGGAPWNEYRDEGAEWQKVKLVPFNPASHDHIALRLQAQYGWKPKEFTNEGKPAVTETILKALTYKPCAALQEYLLVNKRLGQLSEGKEAWLKKEKGGRIHGRIHANGTRTRRATHSGPNMSQVPRISSPYGAECRALFVARPGYVLVGADASGIELRMLSHYLARHDGGAYAKEVVDGDVHTLNQHAMKLHERNSAKTVLYALLYGAGDGKLGSLVAEDLRLAGSPVPRGPRRIAALGRERREMLMQNLPAIGKLSEEVRRRKSLGTIDGWTLTGFSQHQALNTLLQANASIAVKQAIVFLHEEIVRHEWNVHLVGFFHDEVQLETPKEIADEVGQCAVECIRRAGEHFNLRVELDGEYKVGANWSCTH